MTGVIFFGGLVLGFLIGWVGLALLTMSSLHNREHELEVGSFGDDSQ